MTPECGVCLGFVLIIILIFWACRLGRQRHEVSLKSQPEPPDERRSRLYIDGGETKIAWEGDGIFEAIEEALQKGRFSRL